ncbi:hypothetical protein LTR85_005417 [Meristemomyces frigidus]|nr:hypothetical protein LTR85_005417 [Meristemomyces frigidus]
MVDSATDSVQMATSPTPDAKSFRFLDLPPELRNRIYGHVFEDRAASELNVETGSPKMFGGQQIPKFQAVGRHREGVRTSSNLLKLEAYYFGAWDKKLGLI